MILGIPGQPIQSFHLVETPTTNTTLRLVIPNSRATVKLGKRARKSRGVDHQYHYNRYNTGNGGPGSSSSGFAGHQN
jgi:hypothetical protein